MSSIDDVRVTEADSTHTHTHTPPHITLRRLYTQLPIRIQCHVNCRRVVYQSSVWIAAASNTPLAPVYTTRLAICRKIGGGNRVSHAACLLTASFWIIKAGVCFRVCAWGGGGRLCVWSAGFLLFST